MTEKEKNGTDSIYDKDWQDKKELGTVSKTFKYIGKDGEKATVTAKATIFPGQQFEVLSKQNSTVGKNGIEKLDTNKHSRSIVKMVYGIDGTALNNILNNKGPDIYNQMRNFAFDLSGLSLSEDEIDDQKN